MIHTRPSSIFAGMVLGLCLAPAHAQESAAQPVPDLKAVGELGAQLYQESGATGMVLVMVRGNEEYFRGYGETAPGSHEAPAEDSLLRLCSLTKIFTDDILIKLVADKTVRLDDPLQRYAPARVVVPRREGVITLEDLATHTSGLARELGRPRAGTPHFTYPDYATRWRWLPNQRLFSAPGTAALYSNVAYDLLSDALATAAREQYAALLSERTLKPLHMWNTTYFPTAEQCSRLLQGAHDEGPCTITDETAGSSGLYSTAADMTIWLKYLLGDGGPNAPAQDPAAEAVYLQPSALVRQRGLDHAGEPTGIGLGWIHILPSDSPSHIIQKTGGGAGFATYIAINRARHAAIFVAATDGLHDGDINLYDAANNLLLTAVGLPPLPPPERKLVAMHRRRRRHGHVRKRQVVARTHVAQKAAE